jgi:hypothetical protein
MEELWAEIKSSLLSLRVVFDPTDMRHWLGAQDALLSRAEHYIKDEMQRQCARDFSQLVIGNIMEGKYGAASPAMPPYHPRYALWKHARYPEHTWILKGDLLKNIHYFKVAGGWAGGIRAGLMDSGGKSWLGWGNGPSKEIAWYGRILEYGKKKRPVFTPTTDEFAQERWIQIGERNLRQITEAWR